MLTNRREQGYTLVEIMIAMVLAVGSLTAVASLVGYGIGVNANLLNSARLNEELGNAYALMASDLRRTGYTSSTVALVTDPANNPSPFNNTIVVGAFAGEPANSCILFAYDSNDNGVLDIAGPDERFGFRLREGAIEIRRNGALCTDIGWEDITDSDYIDVENLLFTLNQVTDNGITTSTVELTLLGVLVDNGNFSREYRSEIAVRNYDS
ncbi:prepilin-type N-terminal cleavage/methylation domain-containing protein [Alteromonas gilva]|uniref:Prepilin-type N-terminal cleavage/methylation domain-containing protein n=1 Tax=Alteromonas gilva TaxID=2987522 RepID=A0ABT5L6R2_9ALTE|nr:prepilin-type N-terminal cleavage/methylation domain-containing protein [Alteromonas gilva]MDC8832737.1 prepilin-type N-terminal cleavage/methylation domain-containing protein [Alteromonas gilva]